MSIEYKIYRLEAEIEQIEANKEAAIYIYNVDTIEEVEEILSDLRSELSDLEEELYHEKNADRYEREAQAWEDTIHHLNTTFR